MTSSKRQRGSQVAVDAAQRLLNLFFALNASPRPLTTSEIVGDSDIGYGSSQRDSEIRKFHRDRRALQEQGVFICPVKSGSDSMTQEERWAIDRDKTFISGGLLTADDVHVLTDAIDEYLSSSNSPLSGPLVEARNQAVLALSSRGLPGAQCGPALKPPSLNPTAGAVWAAYSTRRKLPFLYLDAKGTSARHVVAVWGIFSQDGYSYFVGWDDLRGQVRTFRTDRIERVWSPKGSYVIPDGFDVRDYLYLPFDFADSEPVPARFRLSPLLGEGEVRALTHNRGTISKSDDGRVTWTVEVRDLDAAAALALEHARDGMRPEAPIELIRRWRKLIQKAVDLHGRE